MIDVIGKEYRSFTEFRAAEDSAEGLWIEGYAATFNSPTVLYTYDGIEYKEQIASSAFTATDMTDVILNYDHAGKVMARTRNKTLQLTIDSKGLSVRASLDGTEEGRRLYEEVKGGYLDKMSFAFSVDTNGDEYDQATHMRTIRKVKRLYDVSIVSMPAYNDTSVSARNYFQTVAKMDQKAQELRAKLLLQTYFMKSWRN